MSKCMRLYICSCGVMFFLVAAVVSGGPAKGPPGHLQWRMDRETGWWYTRVTGDPGTPIDEEGKVVWGQVNRHQYAKVQPWNADQTLLALALPRPLLLDARTFAFVGWIDHESSREGEDRWHPRRPVQRIFVAGNRVGVWDVKSGCTIEQRKFAGYHDLQFGPWEGNPSRDGRRIAVLGRRGQQQVAFAYDLSEDRKYPDIDLTGVRVDWVSISAGGRFIVLLTGRNKGATAVTRVFDLQGERVGPQWASNRPSHYDLTLDASGVEIAIGESHHPDDAGQVILRRLHDGRLTPLVDRGRASHVSARNTRESGWAWASYFSDRPGQPDNDMLINVALDVGGELKPVIRLRSGAQDYVSQAQACPSPDGSQAIWASDWGAPCGRPVHAYLARRHAPESEPDEPTR